MTRADAEFLAERWILHKIHEESEEIFKDYRINFETFFYEGISKNAGILPTNKMLFTKEQYPAEELGLVWYIAEPNTNSSPSVQYDIGMIVTLKGDNVISMFYNSVNIYKF